MKKALDKLNFKYREVKEEEKLKTSGQYNQVADVDILIESNGSQNYHDAIGFKKQQDGTYKAVGDFWGLRTGDGKRVSMESLKCDVTAHSTDAEINNRLSNMGFTLNEEGDHKVEEGKIKVQYRRWV